MKQTKRLLSFILAFVMLASCAVFTAQAADKNAPMYEIDFLYDVEAGTAKAVVSVKGGSFGVGRFGFTYNPDVLTPVSYADEGEEPTLADYVIGEDNDDYSIVATEETNLASELIDTENGAILFAWYAKEDAYVNAAKAFMPIASIDFECAESLKTNAHPTEAIAVAPVADDFDFSGLKGWSDAYVAVNSDLSKKVSPAENVSIIYDIKYPEKAPEDDLDVNAKADGTEITIKWDPVETDPDDGKVVGYVVTVTDKDGNVVTDKDGNPIVIVVEDNGDGSSFSQVITDDNGIKKNEEYVISIQPIIDTDNDGIGDVYDKPATDTVTTKVKKPGGDVTGGGTSTSGSGVSLTYTVLYLPGEGTIPEGQKFKYEVARNGYVSGSPAVIAPEGKVFAGWSVDGVTLISVQVYKITKDTTFKAIYVEREEDTHSPFIVGYPGGEVRAENALTRAEAAAIIARASEGFDEEKAYTEVYFKDVAPDHWAYKYIAYVYENGIVNGYEDSTFHPDSKITRAEFATIMQRYLGITLNEDASFVDVAKDHWAVAYIGACKDAGLINGYEDGTFRPSNEITRAEAVKILNRATDRAPTATAIDAYIAEKGIPFEDLAKGVWYFYEIMEAAFPHLISYYH